MKNSLNSRKGTGLDTLWDEGGSALGPARLLRSTRLDGSVDRCVRKGAEKRRASRCRSE